MAVEALLIAALGGGGLLCQPMMRGYLFTPYDKVRVLSQLSPQEKLRHPMMKDNLNEEPLETLFRLKREGE